KLSSREYLLKSLKSPLPKYEAFLKKEQKAKSESKSNSNSKSKSDTKSESDSKSKSESENKSKAEPKRKHMTRCLESLLEENKEIIYVGEDVRHGGYYLVTD